jgi:hypothetical protein
MSKKNMGNKMMINNSIHKYFKVNVCVMCYSKSETQICLDCL